MPPAPHSWISGRPRCNQALATQKLIFPRFDEAVGLRLTALCRPRRVRAGVRGTRAPRARANKKDARTLLTDLVREMDIVRILLVKRAPLEQGSFFKKCLFFSGSTRLSDFVTPSSAAPGGFQPESAVPVRRERMRRKTSRSGHSVIVGRSLIGGIRMY